MKAPLNYCVGPLKKRKTFPFNGCKKDLNAHVIELHLCVKIKHVFPCSTPSSGEPKDDDSCVVLVIVCHKESQEILFV